MTRLTFLPAPFVRLALATRHDLAEYAIAGIVNEKLRLWRVRGDDTDGGEIPYSGGSGGKVDSVDMTIQDDGTLFVVPSQAAGPGASGSTSQPDPIRIPGVFPPAPASSSGGETYTAAPGGYVRVKSVTRSDVPFWGEETITLPASIPQSATYLHLRVMSAAQAAGAPTYVNGIASIASAIAMYAQVGGARLSIADRRAPGPNHTLYLAATNGALVEFYVDILGWWY